MYICPCATHLLWCGRRHAPTHDSRHLLGTLCLQSLQGLGLLDLHDPSLLEVLHPTTRTIPLEHDTLFRTLLLRRLGVLDAVDDIVAVQTLEVCIPALPALRALCAVGGYRRAVGRDGWLIRRGRRCGERVGGAEEPHCAGVRRPERMHLYVLYAIELSRCVLRALHSHTLALSPEGDEVILAHINW